jgi:hypothetical protein
MSDKTPRELGKEAQMNYEQHRFAAEGVSNATARLGHKIFALQDNDRTISKVNVRKGNYKDWSESDLLSYKVQLVGSHDEIQRELGNSAIAQGYALDEMKMNLRSAKGHYSRNQAGYHDLAVMEAGLDGVQINVQQQAESTHTAEVRTSQQ